MRCAVSQLTGRMEAPAAPWMLLGFKQRGTATAWPQPASKAKKETELRDEGGRERATHDEKADCTRTE